MIPRMIILTHNIAPVHHPVTPPVLLVRLQNSRLAVNKAILYRFHFLNAKPDGDCYNDSNENQGPHTTQDNQHNVKFVEAGAGAGVSASPGVIGGDHLDCQCPLLWEVESLLGSAADVLAAFVSGHQAEGLVD